MTGKSIFKIGIANISRKSFNRVLGYGEEHDSYFPKVLQASITLLARKCMVSSRNLLVHQIKTQIEMKKSNDIIQRSNAE